MPATTVVQQVSAAGMQSVNGCPVHALLAVPFVPNAAVVCHCVSLRCACCLSVMEPC